MKPWLEQCESWLTRQYQNVLKLDIEEGPVKLHWLPANSLTNNVVKSDAYGLSVEDSDIGWLIYLLPYEPERLEPQVNQALGLRSRLLREANYTGNAKAGEKEDQDSTWRVGLVWLVDDTKWADWQRHILDLRRESGAAEEISVDAIKITRNEVLDALEAHGLPRLLLHTRALLSQTDAEAEKWLSADAQVSNELKNFSQQFENPRARVYARELEEKAKSIQPAESYQSLTEARQFLRFRVKNFRNLESLEIVADHTEGTKAQAIILFGPNGTGKSSFAEAISLAAFGTSPRLEQFLEDKDLSRVTVQTYLNDYLKPLGVTSNFDTTPCFSWGGGAETPFNLNVNEESKRSFEGVVLNQEDSINFSELPREKLAAQVLKGYSALADYLTNWLTQEDKRTNEIKLAFTRKYSLSGAIKRSVTAYDRLAQSLLTEQLQRPSPEFLDWLRFIGRLSSIDGRDASKLISDWTSQQSNVVSRLAAAVAKLQELGASQSNLSQAIREKLDEFDRLSNQSIGLHLRLESRIDTLREQLDVALIQMDSWGMWLASQVTAPVALVSDSQALKDEIEKLAKERTELERNGKNLRGRLELLDQAKQFLVKHWSTEHPDTCPVCNSDVADRNGIEMVVTTLQEETNITIQTLRDRHVEIQNRQKDLDAKLNAARLSSCPLATEDQSRLRDWLL